jgi:PTS system galactitol-specific IIA component
MSFAPLAGLSLNGLEASTWEEALSALAYAALDHGYVRDSFPAALVERERRYPTGLPTGLATAIPHADPEHVLAAGLGIARLAHPVSFGEMGRSNSMLDVQLVVMLLVPAAQSHMAALTTVISAVSDETRMHSLLAAHDDQDLEARAAAAFVQIEGK